jgi:hypothetical protein
MNDVFGDPTPQESEGVTPIDQPELQPQQPEQTDTGDAAPPAAGTVRQVPLEALEAERKGRQDWKEKAIRFEEEARQLRMQQEQRAQQPQQPQDPLASMQQQIVNERFNTSEMLARDKYADLDEVVETFVAAAKQNPALAAQMNSHPHPWKFAYDEGKRLKFAAEIGNDPEAYRKKVRAEIEAEIRGATQQSQQPAAPGIPQSLAGARSAGARGTSFTGPTPIDTLFPN